MDMKDLNKSQLIMLALLLSFVTSIATGIVTVTLMQQAPESITIPINRIVRQTVEKIVPGENKSTMQTVVIKEEDLVVDAIAKNQSAIFSITKQSTDESGNPIEVSAGKGFAVSKDGVVVADATLVPDKEVYFVKNNSGKFKADFFSTDKAGFSFLKIGAPLDEKSKLIYTVPTFGNLDNMKAGQKIIVLGNSVSSFIYDGSKDLRINAAKSNGGGLVLDLDGNVLGMVLSSDTASFVSISAINSILRPAEVPKV